MENVRELIKYVPKFVKASMVTQALQLEKAIASSFNTTVEFLGTLAGMPPNYIEKITEYYGEAMFKAFECGYEEGKLHASDIPLSNNEIMQKEISGKFPLSIAKSQEIAEEFSLLSYDLLKTFPGKESVSLQLSKELNNSYIEGAIMGIKEITELNKHQPAMPGESLEMEVKIEEAPAQAPAPMAMATTAETKVELPKAFAAKNIKAEHQDSISRMMAYVKLLDDKEAQNVLMYYLGIDPHKMGKKEAKADVNPITNQVPISEVPKDMKFDIDEPLIPSNKVGPYLLEQTVNKTKAAIQSHKFESPAAEDEFAIIDCVVSGLNYFDSEGSMAAAIALKLEMEDLASPSLKQVEECADELAANLTDMAQLPGHYMFLNVDGDYCLVFVMDRAGVEQYLSMQVAPGPVYASAGKDHKLPHGPQGALSASVQEEVKAIAGFKTMGDKSLKELKKAAPGVAGYLTACVADFRNSKKTMKEVAHTFRMSGADLCHAVHGDDALKYFDYLHGLKK